MEIKHFLRENRFILQKVTGLTHEQLRIRSAEHLPQKQEAEFNALMSRVESGEPLAYVIGETCFYGEIIKVDPRVLIPRGDTELLAELAIAAAKPGARILDLCAGSGCVGIAIKKHLLRSEVIMADIAPYRNGIIELDALKPPPRSLGEFDIIVCNPPYIPTAEIETLDASVRDYEPRIALDGGADGLQFYRAIRDHWQKTAREKIFLETGYNQARTVAEMFENTRIHRDTAGIERVVEICCRC